MKKNTAIKAFSIHRNLQTRISSRPAAIKKKITEKFAANSDEQNTFVHEYTLKSKQDGWSFVDDQSPSAVGLKQTKHKRVRMKRKEIGNNL